jgi:kumamolisin
MPDTHVALPGSRRPMKQGVRRIRDVNPHDSIEITVALRGPKLPDADALNQPPLSREEFKQRYSASEDDAKKVAAQLQSYGLKVEETSLVKRSLTVRGNAAQIEAAFQPQLGIYHDAEQGDFRGRAHVIRVPQQLDGLITGVFGLDERRVARRKSGAGDATGATPLTPADIERRYAFPPGDGAGQVIGIAEFGGGYFPDDVAAFCNKYERAVPSVAVEPVGLQALTPAQIRRLPPQRRNDELGASTEVMMDIEIIAALCPASSIVVYFAPFTQKGWVDLIGKVVAGEPASCSILSVSWGLAEDSQDWSEAARTAINDALKSAALQGITVCVASGDDGSGDQMADGRAHVDFPSCSPSVLSVGGTMLSSSTEVVWWEAPGQRTPNGGGATGGGVSVFLPRPSWQTIEVRSLNAGSIDGRVIPDVAAVAGAPFYDLIFQGQDAPNGGTSASAPVWAALLARVNAALPPGQRPRFLTPILYGRGPDGRPVGASVCGDITRGDNTSPDPGSGYEAGAGFDAVSGWGVPRGEALVTALTPSTAIA